MSYSNAKMTVFFFHLFRCLNWCWNFELTDLHCNAFNSPMICAFEVLLPVIWLLKSLLVRCSLCFDCVSKYLYVWSTYNNVAEQRVVKRMFRLFEPMRVTYCLHLTCFSLNWRNKTKFNPWNWKKKPASKCKILL